MREENKLNTPMTDEVSSEFITTDMSSKKDKRSRMIHYGILAFICLNLIGLYILHFVDRGSSSSSAVAGSFKTSALSVSSASTQKGNAMSFGPDGNLRVGAGTTAYLDAATLPSDKSISFIHFSSLGMMPSNTGIMTYQQGVAPSIESVVTTFSSNPTTKKATIDAAVDKNVIKGSSIKTLATLSSSLAAVLYVTSSADGMKSVTSVAPLTISTDKKVELLQANAKEAATNSATNFITRVSDSSFAVVYYEPYNPVSGWLQRVQVGIMDKDNKITFSNNASFGTPNNNDSSTTVGQPQSVLKSNDRFIVPWFGSAPKTTNTSTNADTRVGLCLTLFTYFSSNNSVANSQEACESQYRPAYFVQSTKLSDTDLLFVFADAANKYALTLATVSVSDITRTFKFRGSYVISEATGAYDFGASFGFFPQPTVQVMSNNRLAVGFLNPSNNGKPSIKVLKYNSDLSIEAVSPVLPISNADFSIATADPNAFGAIVMDMIALETGVMVSYSGSFGGKQQQRVSLVESFGKPVGLVSKVDGSDVDIALSGAVDVDSSLTTGKSYFAATNGQLYAASTSTDDQYVLANDNKMVISKNAMVGVAVSKKKLFVSAV